MNALLLPPETYQRYAQKTLGTKTVLSRGVTGKTYCITFPISDRGQRKKNGDQIFTWVCHRQPSNKAGSVKVYGQRKFAHYCQHNWLPVFCLVLMALCRLSVTSTTFRRSNLFSRSIGEGNCLIRFCWIFLANICKSKGKFDMFCILSCISIVA